MSSIIIPLDNSQLELPHIFPSFFELEKKFSHATPLEKEFLINWLVLELRKRHMLSQLKTPVWEEEITHAIHGLQKRSLDLTPLDNKTANELLTEIVSEPRIRLPNQIIYSYVTPNISQEEEKENDEKTKVQIVYKDKKKNDLNEALLIFGLQITSPNIKISDFSEITTTYRKILRDSRQIIVNLEEIESYSIIQ